jgi:NTP pyrophosphatase (non-canonical NTP hydrolase)
MDLQQLSEEMHRFVTAKGWYGAAEVLEHFQWGESPTDRGELAAELADVTLYLLQLASICQIDLEQAVLDKLKVNYTRTWDQE